MVMKINMKDARDAANLNAVASSVPFSLWVHSVDGDKMADARSLICLLPMIGVPCYLVAEDDTDPKALAKAARRAGVDA